jgi:hypothetical protein
LGVEVPVTRACPEIYLSEEDKNPDYPRSLGLRKPYWVMMAGAKYDTTTKWWNPAFYEQVVDELDGRIDFVQCGNAQDWHPQLQGAVNMVGQTDIRGHTGVHPINPSRRRRAVSRYLRHALGRGRSDAQRQTPRLRRDRRGTRNAIPDPVSQPHFAASGGKT